MTLMIASRGALLVTLGATLACRPPAPAPAPVANIAPAVNTIAPPWTLDVSDGSGNLYRCRHVAGDSARFEYVPVTPQDSSSGVYSGGAPRSGLMTADQVRVVWQLVEFAVQQTDGHVEQRAKGTVSIESNGPTTASVLLRGDAGVVLLATLAELR